MSENKKLINDDFQVGDYYYIGIDVGSDEGAEKRHVTILPCES